MADWSARIELDQAITVEQAETLHDAIDATISSDAGRGRTVVHVTVAASTLRQAADDAIRSVAAAAKQAGLTVRPIRAEVMDADDVPYVVPALVNYAEAGQILGVTRQRVRELDGVVENVGRHPDFPQAVARPASGALFDQADIERFKAAWQRRKGRPPSRPDA